MKVIKYQMLQGDKPCNVTIDYNEENLEIAKNEAINGEYTVEETDTTISDGVL